MEEQASIEAIEACLNDMEKLADHADSLLEEFEDYYATLAAKFQSTKKKLDLFVESMFDLSVEEICLESYSCFMQVSRLAALLSLHEKQDQFFLITGKEDQEEAWHDEFLNTFEQIEGMFHTIDAELVEKYGKQALFSYDTSFGFGVQLAKSAEEVVADYEMAQYSSVDSKTQAKMKLQALELLADLGLTSEEIEQMVIDDHGNVKDGAWGIKELGHLEEADDIHKRHEAIMKDARLYRKLLLYMILSVQQTLKDCGWHKYDKAETGEKLLRMTAQRIIYCGKESVKKEANGIIAEVLFDEGEDITKDKVEKARKAINARFKTNKVVNLFRLNKGQDFLDAIVAEHSDLKDLNDFFLYYTLMMSLDNYKESAKEDVDPKRPIEIKNNLAPLIDNHDGGVINLDEYMKRALENLLKQNQIENK